MVVPVMAGLGANRGNSECLEGIMPLGDKTGPRGKGPKTGRGLGYCAGNDRPGADVPRVRRGRGRRIGGVRRGR